MNSTADMLTDKFHLCNISIRTFFEKTGSYLKLSIKVNYDNVWLHKPLTVETGIHNQLDLPECQASNSNKILYKRTTKAKLNRMSQSHRLKLLEYFSHISLFDHSYRSHYFLENKYCIYLISFNSTCIYVEQWNGNYF